MQNMEKPGVINPHVEEAYYEQALARVMESDSRIKAGGDIRVGEHILLVDSDTRVVSSHATNLDCQADFTSRVACRLSAFRCR